MGTGTAHWIRSIGPTLSQTAVAVGRIAINFSGLETTPVVVDGVMYVTGNNQVYALSAKTGRADLAAMSGPRAPGRRSPGMRRSG